MKSRSALTWSRGECLCIAWVPSGITAKKRLYNCQQTYPAHVCHPTVGLQGGKGLGHQPDTLAGKDTGGPSPLWSFKLSKAPLKLAIVCLDHNVGSDTHTSVGGVQRVESFRWQVTYSPVRWACICILRSGAYRTFLITNLYRSHALISCVPYICPGKHCIMQ